MQWLKRDSGNSVLEVVMHNSGMTESELIYPQETKPLDIEGLVEASSMIKAAVKDNTPISIMGDYDADGITASSILYLTMRHLGITPIVRLPKRMSEGYGLSANAVHEFSKGLLITVDNGISAFEAISEAKGLGFKVIIMDHHLPAEMLPNADVIVDPHIHPDKNGFEDYCGAGLAYKLAQLLTADSFLLDQLCSLAAIGTIADGVPLRGDNRYIVKRGLNLIARGKVPIGLKTLLSVADISHCDEKDIGFRIGPMLNAAGRMYDDGAKISFEALTAENSKTAITLCERLAEINEERKESTSQNMEYAENLIAMQCLYGDVPLVIFAEGMHEGIVGIITGRLAEKYKVPTFVLTDSNDPDIYKGSGRTYGNVNLKTDILDKVSGILIHGGGHAAAAGISVCKDRFDELVSAMHATMADYQPEEQDTVEYDLAIKAEEIKKVLQEVRKYAPYGEGNHEPVFMIADVTLSPKYGQTSKFMGKKAEHIKLYCPGFSAVCFGKSQEYRDIGSPARLDFVGTLSENIFHGNTEIQLETIDFREAASKKGRSSLLDALKENGTI